MNVSIKIGFIKQYIGLLDDHKDRNFNDNKRLCYIEDFTEFVTVFPNKLECLNEELCKQITVSMLLNRTGYIIEYDNDIISFIVSKLSDRFVIEEG